MESNPFFSVILSTRDRPELFQTALHSIADQNFADKEIVVVVDGSSDENLAEYKNIEQQHTAVVFHFLTHRSNGHGQSYAMNYGASKSSGTYLCFLDDDDEWTDTSYLQNVADAIAATSGEADVHYSHQKAQFADGSPQTEQVWLEDLIPQVNEADAVCEGTYRVDAGFLLTSAGFAHLNCSVFSRAFYQSIGGMDESIRYENDRDVFIRSIDAAKTILMSTRYMSLHHIPDVNKKDNMSTMSSNIEKKLYQMRVYDKGIALGQSPVVISFCRRAKTYEQKHLATILDQNGDVRSAAQYAREALLGGFNLRWLAYTLQVSFKALFDSNRKLSS